MRRFTLCLAIAAFVAIAPAPSYALGGDSLACSFDGQPTCQAGRALQQIYQFDFTAVDSSNNVLSGAGLTFA